jgi:hypothetical protein
MAMPASVRHAGTHALPARAARARRRRKIFFLNLFENFKFEKCHGKIARSERAAAPVVGEATITAARASAFSHHGLSLSPPAAAAPQAD